MTQQTQTYPRRTIGRPALSLSRANLIYVITAIAVAVITACLFWLVWIYGSGLRDPRYLDGWILVGGMCAQLGFHLVRKTLRLSPPATQAWRYFHIVMGFLLVAIFLQHSDFALPDTVFEWLLWTGFVTVSLSGLLGTYLAWTKRTKTNLNGGINLNRASARHRELAQHLRALVVTSDNGVAQPDLPALPYAAWILSLYTEHLRDFISARRSILAHIVGSSRPLVRILDEIDVLSQYVDEGSKIKLSAIRTLVIEKNELDVAYIHLWLTQAWLFVHVPVTYMLIVATVLHVLVVYAYSSGAW